MIGIIDVDFLLDVKWKYPNLEAMKVLTYLHQNNKMVKLITDFTNLKIYEKLYYFQNSDNISIQHQCFQHPNIEWHGNVFSNNQYVYLEPNIEVITPNIYLYRPLINLLFQRGKLAEKDVTHLLNGNFIRLQTDQGRHIFDHRTRNYLYDRKLCDVPDWMLKMEKLYKLNAKHFCPIFPNQSANTIMDFIKLQQMPMVGDLVYHYDLPLITNRKDFLFFVEQQTPIKVGFNKNLYYSIIYNKICTPLQHLQTIAEYLNILCVTWAHKIPMTIKLTNQEVQPFTMLEKRIGQWMKDDFLRKLSLGYVLEVNSREILTYEIKKIFKEYNVLLPFHQVIPNELIKGGFWPYDWKRNL